MLAADEKLKQSFSLLYVDGSIRAKTSSAASPDTVLFMSRCLQLMTMQMIGRAHRAGNDRSRHDLAEPTPETPAQPTIAAPGATPGPAPATPAAPVGQAAAAPLQWLSGAIDTWRADGTTFSEESWTFSYKPSFRVFRELIADVRRDRTLRDGSLASGHPRHARQPHRSRAHPGVLRRTEAPAATARPAHRRRRGLDI